MKRATRTISLLPLALCLLFTSAYSAYAQGTPGTIRFPDNLDTQDSLLRPAENAGTLLNAAITNSATSITLLDASRFPSSGLAVIESEKITWTGKSANTLTGVVRGARGTSAAAHASGVAVRIAITKDFHEVLRDALIAAQTKVGSGASIPANGKFLKGTGAGASAWGDVLIADVSGLQSALDSKAAASHTHAQADITGLVAALAAKQNALGFTPLNPANNLSDLANAATARTNLGLGSLAVVTPTGTPNGAKFLRDDFSWQAVSASPGGSSGDIQYNNAGAFGGIGSTGTGNVVRATSPALVTPTLQFNGSTLVSDGANVLALRNGNNGQRFNIYNAYTDASNFEQGFLIWYANSFGVGTSQLGTGTARNLRFWSGGTERWEVNGTSGHLLTVTDNAYDVGASGATRPRTGYFGTSIVAPKFCYTSTVCDFASAGSPEGVITAGVGSTYRNTTDGSFYRKTTGAGNTGWTTP